MRLRVLDLFVTLRTTPQLAIQCGHEDPGVSMHRTSILRLDWVMGER